MYQYSIQVDWPSEFEKGAYGYDVETFNSITLLSTKEILGKLKKETIINEIKSGILFSNVKPKNDSQFVNYHGKVIFQRRISCESENKKASLLIEKLLI